MDKLNILSPNPIITEIRNKFSDNIEFLEKKYNLPTRSLLTQLGLHIYKYDCEDLFSCNQFDINKVKQYSINRNLIFNELFLLINYLKQDLPIYEQLKKESKSFSQNSKLISVGEAYQEINELGMWEEVTFKKVPSHIGIQIQENIHYIKSRRQDTLFEFGFFRKDASVPFAYVAFSLLDRHYLLNLPIFGGVPKDKIYVLTRAYSFPNSPHNTMSALYSKSLNYLKKEVGAVYVVTALNQNLFFDGSSLKSANFDLIAYSPMKYYYLDGMYATRRKVKRERKYYREQLFKPGQIMWFGKNLILPSGRLQNKVPTTVTEEIYDLQ